MSLKRKKEGIPPREIVRKAITFRYPERIPRDLWVLPWAVEHYPDAVAEVQRRYPSDFAGAPDVYRPSPRVKGAMYAKGTFTDEWGCRFVNIQNGVQGEVREPILADLRRWEEVKPPYEILPSDPEGARKVVNEFCAKSDKFVLAGCCPRPWERYQFIRGSEQSLMDMADPSEEAVELLNLIHDFFLEEMQFWVNTDVDAIRFMDDWGSQHQLLIRPEVWRELFKPLYRDYCEFAHGYGKFAFMHSDGHIAEIFEDLVEIGVDAINSQLFCMDMADLARRVKGKITFWGEIDRQHILPSQDPEDGRRAVREVARHLYDPSGGIIAQLEFGAGANPATVMAVYEEWERITAGKG
ncbi:MAG: methyltransferase [candidate division KSB1 bacterium]|nr:methyltransferase [candidate division KSB1 bacterium]